MITLFVQIQCFCILFFTPIDQSEHYQGTVEESPSSNARVTLPAITAAGVDLIADNDDPIEAIDDGIAPEYATMGIIDNPKASYHERACGDTKGRSPPLPGRSHPPFPENPLTTHQQFQSEHALHSPFTGSRKDLPSTGTGIGTQSVSLSITNCAINPLCIIHEGKERRSSILHSTVIGLFGHSHALQNPFMAVKTTRYRPKSDAPTSPGVYCRSREMPLTPFDKMHDAIFGSFHSSLFNLPGCLRAYRL